MKRLDEYLLFPVSTTQGEDQINSTMNPYNFALLRFAAGAAQRRALIVLLIK